MRKTKANIAKVEALARVRDQMKELKAMEKQITDFLKVELQAGELFDAGEIKVLAQEMSRTALDKKALEHDLGDKLRQYETKTTYKQLKIVR